MLDIKLYEFKENLIKLMNESGLPLSMLSAALADVKSATDQAYTLKIQEYKKSMMKGEMNNGTLGQSAENRDNDSERTEQGQ